MFLGGSDRLLSLEKLKPRRVGATLGRFWRYFSRYRGRMALLVVFLAASVYAQVIAPRIVGQAVDCYLFPRDPATCWYADVEAGAAASERLDGLLGLALVVLGLYVGTGICNSIAFYSMRSSGERVLYQMRRDLFRQIHRLSLSFYTRNEAGNVMSRITSDMDTIQLAFSFALMQVLGSVMLMVWIVVEMLREDFTYGLVSLTAAPVMLGATLYFSSQARKAFRLSRREMGSVNANLQEKIAGAREVQAFNNERESIEQFRQTNAANRDANIRAASFTSALTPVLEALGYVAVAVVILYGGLALLRGSSSISLGLMMAFVLYVQTFNRPIQQIALMWTNVQSAVAGGERIFELLDEQPEITDRAGAVELPPVTGRVEFAGVWAEYNAGEPVLRDVSFTAEPGQTVAIVGPTGAGKTTIINLLPRFYDVTQGAVKIDGYDVRDVTLASLRSQIGLVLQDTFLFSTTVLDNIRYGRLEASDEEVMAAARLVGADGFIERLPQGYQTVLGERGSGLSQGQRQLIAIARAALMQPRLLILDEATSSVDTRTERIIQKAFEKLLEGRTSFVIAHRLSTIRSADQVLMLRDGEIIERGTHRSLLEEKGAYYELYMSQFRRQEETEAAPSAAGS